MSLVGANGQPLGVTAPQKQENPGNAEPKAPKQVTTAFVVYQLPNGQWMATADIFEPMNPARKASPNDFISGAANVQSELTASRAAEMAAGLTVQTMASMQRQAMEQAQTAQVQQLLQNGK